MKHLIRSAEPRGHRLRVLALLTCALALAACGDSGGPTDPSDPPDARNLAPAVDEISLAKDGYSRARLTGSASDPEGGVASVVVDWGDGQSSDVTNSYASIRLSHRYDRAQDYTVTVMVTDDQGQTSQRSASISIQVPDPACIDFLKVVSGCISMSRDLRNFRLEFRIANKIVYESEIKDGKGDVRVPLAGGFGMMVVGFDMDRGRITIGGEVCVVPHLVCQEVASKTIQLET